MSKKYLFLFFLILISFLPASSQESKPFTIQKLGKQYGLTDNYISDIVQDKRGIFWLAGLNGLVRFDGQSTEHFTLPFYKNKILGSNILSTLFLENDSILWITNSQGVCRFNVYRYLFEPIPIEKDYPSQTLNFSVIKRDQTERIWLSAREVGLMNYDEKANVIRKTNLPGLAGLTRVRNYYRVGDEYFLFCTGKGFTVYNVLKQKVEMPNSVADLNYLGSEAYEGTAGDVYFGKQISYSTVRQKNNPYYSVVAFNKTNNHLSQLPVVSDFGFKYFNDSRGNVWIYNDGINVVEASSGKLYKAEIGKSQEFSQCYMLYEDRDRNIWFCTNNGLYVMEPDKLILENRSEKKDGQYLPHIYTAVEKSGTDVWLGTYGEGVVLCNTDLTFKKNIDLGKLSGDPRQNNISVIYACKQRGDVWIGSALGRLALYHGDSKSFRFFSDTLFHEQRILSITEDASGRVYFGTNAGRIIRFGAEKKFELIYNELAFEKDAIDYISGMIFSGDNILYVSTSFNGLYQLTLHTGNIKTYKLDPENDNSIKSNDLYCLKEIGNRGYFMGSTNGLIRFDPARQEFQAFTPADGLPFTEIYNLSPYEGDELLAVTSDGLYRINFEKRTFLEIGVDSPVESVNFSSLYYDAAEKMMLLCSDDYFYSLEYEPRSSGNIPVNHIYAVKVRDTTFNFSEKLPEEIVLRRDQNDVSIVYGASGYKYKDKINYYYRIDELGDAWIDGNSGEASFSGLKGGHYTFRVKMVRRADNKVLQELPLEIEIKKAFHETIWLYLLMTALVIVILYGAYRIRLNKLLAVERVRQKLSRDLHDDIGSTLSTINILSSMAGKKIKNDPETSVTYLEKISANSQDIMENMGDIVWSINPANDDMHKVISKMREFATTILEPKNIKFEMQVGEEVNSMHLRMEYRRDLFLIYKETINNAAKHSGCSRVKVIIQVKNRNLSVQIVDNGKGIDLAAAENGNGLTNIRRRASAIKGEIIIDSGSEGTSITLNVPVSVIT